MRRVGRVCDWNDEKGFGFVVPHDGGARTFVHIKAFQPGSRRPADGDLISYEPTKDAKGRPNAVSIRFARQRAQVAKPSKPLPRRPMTLAFFAAMALGVGIGRFPVVLAAAYVLLSLASYIMYYVDKVAAGKGLPRTPEATLHLVDLAGGWPGALVAQQRFRHKTVKASFQTTFWLTVFLNLGFVAWLVGSGTAQRIASTLVGG